MKGSVGTLGRDPVSLMISNEVVPKSPSLAGAANALVLRSVSLLGFEVFLVMPPVSQVISPMEVGNSLSSLDAEVGSGSGSAIW